MKKHLFFLLFAITASAGTLFAESGTCGANLEWKFSDGTLTISSIVFGRQSSMTNWSSSSDVPWYSLRTSITRVTIGSDATSIGSYAFSGCTRLTSLSIGSNVKSIENYAFSGCTGLTTVALPSRVTSVGDYAFSGCTGLTSPVYNEHVFARLPKAYSGSYTIPDGTESIVGFAFSGCSNLTDITIPYGVKNIGMQAFSGCFGLTNIKIPSSVTRIENYTFSGCTGLVSCKIPNSVTRIGQSAFANCSGLTSVIIGNSVDTIAGSAFSGCTGLTSITIPINVLSVAGNAFSGCSNLTSLTVENGNSVYDSRDNCNAVIKTSTNTLVVGCKNTIIPKTVTSLGAYAFAGHSGLTTITIPNSVTYIQREVFSGCSGLTSVIIGNSVDTIADSAFSGCSGLTTITIPNSVTYIGSYAFYDCSGLTTVIIGKGVTIFKNYAFQGCTGLTDVYNLAITPQNINSLVFKGIDLEDVTLHVPYGTLNAYKTANIWKTFGTIVEGEWKYTIVWQNYDETILKVDSLLEGATPSYSGETPTKPATAQYNYAFKGWEPEIVPVNGDATYTAIYDSTKIEYNIDITIPDTIDTHGTVTIDGEPTYGDTITLTAIPEEGYHFVEWNDGNTDNPRQIIILGDTAIYPIFAKDVFLITFVNYNGTELQSDSVEYGAMPVYNGETPIKPATAQYTYTFKSWKPEVVTVTGNAVYTAEFDSVVNQYTITFNNYDGTQLQSGKLDYGVLPTFNGATPTKPSDKRNDYAFSGWSPAIAEVTGDATYTAQFNATPIIYNITTEPATGEQHGSVDINGIAYYEATVTLTATPEDGYYFVSWNDGVTDNPRQIVVVSDTTLYPIFAECEPITTNITATIYDDGSYRVGDEVFTTRGTHRVTLSAANGCDSVVVLRLNVIKLPTYNVRLEVNELMGSVAGAGTYKQGDAVTITATPKAKSYRFVHWFNAETGEKIMVNPYTFTVTEDVLLRAAFTRQAKAITIEYRAAPKRMIIDEEETYAIVTVEEKSAEINNISGETYYIYDASGKLISTSREDKQYVLPSGMYIIRIEDQAEKFIVP